jgi:hypothetical protein
VSRREQPATGPATRMVGGDEGVELGPQQAVVGADDVSERR